MSEYPMSDLLDQNSDDLDIIDEFFEWLRVVKGHHLGAWVAPEDALDEATFVQVITPLQQLMYEYFGIDEFELESERRKMLAFIREHTDRSPS